jgi:hypothetical protein
VRPDFRLDCALIEHEREHWVQADALATIAGGGLLLGWLEIANGNPFI